MLPFCLCCWKVRRDACSGQWRRQTFLACSSKAKPSRNGPIRTLPYAPAVTSTCWLLRAKRQIGWLAACVIPATNCSNLRGTWWRWR